MSRSQQDLRATLGTRTNQTDIDILGNHVDALMLLYPNPKENDRQRYFLNDILRKVNGIRNNPDKEKNKTILVGLQNFLRNLHATICKARDQNILFDISDLFNIFTHKSSFERLNNFLVQLHNNIDNGNFQKFREVCNLAPSEVFSLLAGSGSEAERKLNLFCKDQNPERFRNLLISFGKENISQFLKHTTTAEVDKILERLSNRHFTQAVQYFLSELPHSSEYNIFNIVKNCGVDQTDMLEFIVSDPQNIRVIRALAVSDLKKYFNAKYNEFFYGQPERKRALSEHVVPDEMLEEIKQSPANIDLTNAAYHDFSLGTDLYDKQQASRYFQPSDVHAVSSNVTKKRR